MTTLNTSKRLVPKTARNNRIYPGEVSAVSRIGGTGSSSTVYTAGNGITIAAGEISLDTNFIEVVPAQGVKLKYNNITELEVISGGVDIKNILKTDTLTEHTVDGGVTIPVPLAVTSDAMVTGQLGVGGVMPYGTIAALFRGASTDNDWTNTILVEDNRVLAAGTGGGISFGGIYKSDGTYTQGGFIRVEKENDVHSEFGYDLLIGNRIDGVPCAAQMMIAASDGRVRINQSMDSMDTTFASGFTGAGWKLLKTGSGGSAKYSFEVDNLRVRGAMNVYELILNKIRCTNGSFWISDAGEIDSVDTSVSYDKKILFDTSGDEAGVVFLVNDIIRCQQWNRDGIGASVKLYIAQVMAVGADYIEVDMITGSSDLIAVGDTIVRQGNTSVAARQNAIYMTASDDDNPYIDVLSGVTSYLISDADKKVRLGNLAGITDADFPTISGYGLYAVNAYLKGGIYATFGEIGGWKIDSDAIYSGTKKITDGYSTSGITFDALGAIHAENFYINSDGSIAARNIILETDPDATYNYSTKIEDYNIYENNVNAASSTQINMKGYQGGFTQYRRTYIGNGKNNSLLSLIGSNNELGGTIEVKCQQKVYGRLIYPVSSHTSTFTVSEDDPVTICTNTAAIIVYLNASPVDGESYIIKRAHTGAVTVNGNGTNIRNLTHNDVASMVYATQEGHAFIYNLSLDLWFIMFSCNI